MGSAFFLDSMLVALFLLIAGPLVAVWFAKRTKWGMAWLHIVGIVGTAGLAIASLPALDSPVTRTQMLWQGVFSFATLTFRVNSLTSVFTLLIGLVGMIVSVYAVGYLKHYGPDRPTHWLLAGTSLFLGSMAAVILAANVFTFLLSWELMALVSFLLLLFEHHKPEVRTAAYVYVAMTHLGTVFLILAFFMLFSYTGSFQFDAMSRAIMQQGTLPLGVRNWVFLFALIGFGTKAGLLPFHVWLPRAHPVAPSHVSALMSGVMLKTAVFGFVLVLYVLLPPGPLWWGVVTAGVGASSGLAGALHAANESDQKRLLAYSSIENLGLVFLGLGLGLVFRSLHLAALESLALVATLYHVISHGVFKSLLFLAAGAVLSKTHRRNMDELGGLVHRMPWTSLFMLIASLSISAFPPFTGYVSEWLWIQSLFGLAVVGSAGMKLLAVVLLTSLTLTGAWVALTFVRLFGTSFLALPRTEQAATATEIDGWMRSGMGALAVLCVGLGIASAPGQHVLTRLVARLMNEPSQLSPSSFLASSHAAGSFPGPELGVVAGVMALGVGLAMAMMRWLGRNSGATQVRRETWTCGGTLEPRMSYTATGFSKPIRVAFKWALPATRVVQTETGGSRYFPNKLIYRHQLYAFAESRLYRPLIRWTVNLAQGVRRIQNGQVQSYLAYLFVALLVVLLWASEGGKS